MSGSIGGVLAERWNVKGADFERLARSNLLSSLPAYAVKGRLLFHTPIQSLLRGVIWNKSGFARYLASVDVFIQPLYVPFDQLVLTYQARDKEGYVLLRGDWTIDPADPHPEIDRLREEPKAVTASFRDEVPNEAAFAAFLERSHRERTRPGIDPYLALAWGATLVLINETEHALRLLDFAIAYISTRVDSPEWVHAVAGQCEQLAELAREDPSLAIAKLAEWRRGTLRALKLTPWAVMDWP